MPTKKKPAKQWNTYEEYLQSDQWKKLKKAAHGRVISEFGEVLCECCFSPQNPEVHHWMYRPWSQDYSDLHVVLCSGCHSFAHDEFPPDDVSIEVKTRDKWLVEFLRSHYINMSNAKAQRDLIASDRELQEQQKVALNWQALGLQAIMKLTGEGTSPEAIRVLVDAWEVE